MNNSSVNRLFKLSIPIFFSNLIIPLVGIVDTGLMGNLDNPFYLAATSIAANFFSMLFWSFGFLRMGTVGMVSQAHGRENYKEIYNIILRNFIFVLIISITIILSQNYIFLLCLSILC